MEQIEGLTIYSGEENDNIVLPVYPRQERQSPTSSSEVRCYPYLVAEPMSVILDGIPCSEVYFRIGGESEKGFISSVNLSGVTDPGYYLPIIARHVKVNHPTYRRILLNKLRYM